MNINDIKNQVENKIKNNYKPNNSKKKVLLGVIALLLGALGLELSNTDFDLGKLAETGSLSESKVKRDIDGNIVTDGTGKGADEYNCDDFKTQVQAQKFYTNAGGVSKDTNRLDGDKNGLACQDLPQ